MTELIKRIFGSTRHLWALAVVVVLAAGDLSGHPISAETWERLLWVFGILVGAETIRPAGSAGGILEGLLGKKEDPKTAPKTDTVGKTD